MERTIPQDNKILKAPSKKPTRLDKEALCKDWKRSGLSKNAFCKKLGLSLATFCGWYRRLYPQEVKSRGPMRAVKIIPKAPLRQDIPEDIMVELLFPNQVSARVHLKEAEIGAFFRELMNATAVIR